jgi:hypothetical protein
MLLTFQLPHFQMPFGAQQAFLISWVAADQQVLVMGLLMMIMQEIWFQYLPSVQHVLCHGKLKQVQCSFLKLKMLIEIKILLSVTKARGWSFTVIYLSMSGMSVNNFQTWWPYTIYATLACSMLPHVTQNLVFTEQRFHGPYTYLDMVGKRIQLHGAI